MKRTLVIVVLGAFLAAGAACKKKAEASGKSEPAATPAALSGGDLEPPGAADQSVEGERGGTPTEGLAAHGATDPAGGTGGTVTPPPPPPPAQPGEAPRTLACSRSEMAWDPTEPDPEAGDFTMDEALAGLAGAGQPVATIETSLGTVSCALAGDKVPRAVANFVGLARGLRPWWDPCRKAWVKEPFYDGLTFHRVIPRFMAQGGDLFGNGMGGPGYMFANEISPDLRHDRPGTLAYANSGPDTNGSQFYITVGTRPQLDGDYVVFGYCDNPGVIESIVAVPRDRGDVPLSPVLIRKVTITRGG